MRRLFFYGVLLLLTATFLGACGSGETASDGSSPSGSESTLPPPTHPPLASEPGGRPTSRSPEPLRGTATVVDTAPACDTAAPTSLPSDSEPTGCAAVTVNPPGSAAGRTP
jgi:hypothetical protein